MRILGTIILAAALALGVVGGAYAVDKDRVEGSTKQLKGKVKETAGNLSGDERLKTKGKKERAVGKAQNTWGNVKDDVRNATR